MTELFEDVFDNDGKTAYVFTADHGMTNWGMIKLQFIDMFGRLCNSYVYAIKDVTDKIQHLMMKVLGALGFGL